MSTVASVLTAIKYDMRNYADIEYDVDQVLHYLNRSIDMLDNYLVSMNSDQTLAETIVAISKGYDYISVPTRCLAVREIWIDDDRKTGVDMDELYYRRQFKRDDKESGESISSGDLCYIVSQSTTDFTTVGAAANTAGTYFVSTGSATLGSGDVIRVFQGQEVQFWTWVAEQVQFEAGSASEQNITVIYDQGSADVTATGDMPYAGNYDNILREVTVQMLYAKKNKEFSQTDAAYQLMFDNALSMRVINRKHTRKLYKLDF